MTSEADVVFGQYDPVARAFVPGAQAYNAVQVRMRRTSSTGNAVKTIPSAFAGSVSLVQ